MRRIEQWLCALAILSAATPAAEAQDVPAGTAQESSVPAPASQPTTAPKPAATPAPGAADLTTMAAELARQAAALEEARKELSAQRAEIEEVRGTAEAAEAEAEAADSDAATEPAFRLYGFIDMGLQRIWAAPEPVLPTNSSTFVLGNVNLYFDFHPAPAWSSLVEVRFTSYPRGDDYNSTNIPGTSANYGRVNTTVSDPGNGPGWDVAHWGAIVLERAYIQWQKADTFGLRVGQFLTPYGIWNVDHGTPTLISLYRPKSVTNEMWPETQLGVEAFGRLNDVLPGRWTAEYHAYVSNGRTDGPTDPTDDKMVGGRLALSTTRPYPMTFGASAMMGRYSSQQRSLASVSASGVGMFQWDEVVAFDERGLAFDGSVDLGGLRLRSELTLRDLEYDRGKRAQSWIPGVYEADQLQWDVYGLAAYRLPGSRLEPYAYFEVFRWPTILGELLVRPSAGLNIYFTPGVQLKLQVGHERWMDTDDIHLGAGQSPSTFVAGKLVMGL